MSRRAKPRAVRSDGSERWFGRVVGSVALGPVERRLVAALATAGPNGPQRTARRIRRRLAWLQRSRRLDAGPAARRFDRLLGRQLRPAIGGGVAAALRLRRHELAAAPLLAEPLPAEARARRPDTFEPASETRDATCPTRGDAPAAAPDEIPNRAARVRLDDARIDAAVGASQESKSAPAAMQAGDVAEPARRRHRAVKPTEERAPMRSAKRPQKPNRAAPRKQKNAGAPRGLGSDLEGQIPTWQKHGRSRRIEAGSWPCAGREEMQVWKRRQKAPTTRQEA